MRHHMKSQQVPPFGPYCGAPTVLLEVVRDLAHRCSHPVKSVYPDATAGEGLAAWRYHVEGA